MSLKCSPSCVPEWGSKPDETYDCYYEYNGCNYLVGDFRVFPREDGTFRLRFHFGLPGPTLADHPCNEKVWSPKSYPSKKEAAEAGGRIIAHLFQRADGHNHIVLYAATKEKVQRASREEYAAF